MKQENRDPVFPLAVFPEKIRSVIESARSESNYPVSYIASAMLFAVSVAIGNCRTLVVNASWKVKAILFMSLLGSPGSNRKASREEEIAQHGKQVLFRTTKQKSRKVYDRKRLKKAGINSDVPPES